MSVLGLLVAFAAFEHGLGELVQEPVPPESVAIESWPDSQPFEVVSGEPAMTIIPNLAVAGLATMGLACAFAAWAWVATTRRRGAVRLVVLSVLLLLAGGGFAPPVIGLILAAAVAWPRRRAADQPPARLAGSWRPLLALTVVAYLSGLSATLLAPRRADPLISP